LRIVFCAARSYVGHATVTRRMPSLGVSSLDSGRFRAASLFQALYRTIADKDRFAGRFCGVSLITFSVCNADRPGEKVDRVEASEQTKIGLPAPRGLAFAGGAAAFAFTLVLEGRCQRL
jgi:hypothetical protein